MSDDEQVSQPTSMLSQIGSILIRPRTTMARLIADTPTRGLILFPLLMGLLTAVPTALSVEATYALNRNFVWVGSLVLSVIGYWMYVYVYGGVYKIIGRWFGEQDGTIAAGRLALAWTQVPYILSGLIFVPVQVIYRDEFFPEIDTDSLRIFSGVEHTPAFWGINVAMYLTIFVIYIWSNFLLAEALRCSTWKALAIKLTAFGLHIPMFIVLFVLAFVLVAALVMTGVYAPAI